MPSPRLTLLLAALPGMALGACRSLPAECDPVCDAARERFAVCLDEWGLEWGDRVGYADETDFRNWCGTWMAEQQELAAAAEDPGAAFGALADRCQLMEGTFVEGPCGDYASAWAEPE